MDKCAEIAEGSCRDSHGAFNLKLVALAVILVASAAGVGIPVLLARFSKGLRFYNSLLLLVKCFAAGVILSTGFVHVLPEAFEALGNECLPAHPWRDFPFAGAVALAGALVTLMVDILATNHGENKVHYVPLKEAESQNSAKSRDIEMGSVIVNSGTGAACCSAIDSRKVMMMGSQSLDESEEYVQLRQRLVSQVLEIGIIFHSVIIGITLGMSQNQCTIGPLVGALAFHQFFEGMGLGGCVAQAGFRTKVTALMCMMFSVTTPVGIAVGMAVHYLSGYNESSPKALILEGLFGSASSGILVYMALVDLIAAEFLNSKKMKSDPCFMAVAYLALVLGAATMSLLALWA